MNKIYLLLLMALTLSLLVASSHRWKRMQEPFCITYHVSTHSLSYHKILITYADSTGLVQETFIGRKWKKEVCLPPNGLASLRIDEIFTPGDLPYYMKEPCDTIHRDFEIKPISIQIEHKNKVRLEAGQKTLHVSLFASEVDK